MLSVGILCAGMMAVQGCAGKGSSNRTIADARDHVPHTTADDTQNPYIGVNRAEEMEDFFPEYNYQRFGKGLRMGMTENEVVRLAQVPARKRLTGNPGEEEFTFTWPREQTGFRVMMRDGRTIAWMSERAVLLEPERLRQ